MKAGTIAKPELINPADKQVILVCVRLRMASGEPKTTDSQ